MTKSYRKALSSKAAAAALAYSLAHGSAALAGEEIDADPSMMAANSNGSHVTQLTTQQAGSVVQADETPEKGELTNSWSVTVDPMGPLTLTGIGGAAALYTLFCLWGAGRRTRGSLARMGAGWALALTLVNPQILEEEREPLPTEVLVVVDKSESQSIGDRDKETTAIYSELVDEFSAKGDINLRVVEVEGMSADSNVRGTMLFNALEENLVDIPRDRLGAVIMLTDGQVHDTRDVSKLLGDRTPLHVLVSGREGEEDRQIVVDEAPRFSLVDQEQTIKFRVVGNGTDANSAEMVEVKVSLEGREIMSKHAQVGDVVTAEVNIPHTGANLIEIEAETSDNEITGANNRIVVPVEGIRESLSVLLISGEPNKGMRMWRDLLKSDPDTDLVHFTIMRPPEKQDYTPLKELSLIPVPTHEIFMDKMEKFDLIVLDDYKYRGILPKPYLGKIAEHVKDGGALFVVAGDDYAGKGSLYYTPLSSVLPSGPGNKVVERAYKPAVSETGERHPVTRGLDQGEGDTPEWGNWYQQVDIAKPEAGYVVMEGNDEKPLLVLDRKGDGRVATLLSDNAWLWARGHDGGGPYADLLRRTTHWLIENPELEDEALRLTRQGDKLIIEQQTMADESEPVTIKAPSGKTVSVALKNTEPGLWRAEIPADEMGLYSAERFGEHNLKTHLNVGPADPKEFTSIFSTTAKLKPVVTKTGGYIGRMTTQEGSTELPKLKYRDASEQVMSGSDWAGVKMTDASVLKGAERNNLIPPWLGFAFVVGLLAWAWHREAGRSMFKKKDTDQAQDNSPGAGNDFDGPSI